MAAALATISNPAAAAASASLHAPASPFAELLRRSKFASFDPAIRRTYEAPPEYAHRGNWGLKRPIALRRRNAFITIKSGFEHPAQFIEWNNAESQVRFVRRIEEMNVTPTFGSLRTPWVQEIGSALHEWVMDSDYAPAEENAVNPSKKNITHDLEGLGRRGAGQYSKARQHTPSDPSARPKSHVQPNIYAMSPKDFKRYLHKLRTLRPQFYAHLQKEAAEKLPELRGKSLFHIAQNTAADYHRTFLAAHTAAEFADREQRRIEQQPHRFGALTYAHPSPLDTQLTTDPQPGLVLQQKLPEGRAARYAARSSGITVLGRKDLPYIAAFGGLTSTLDQKNASPDALPLLNIDSEKGIDPARLKRATALMRVIPGSLKLVATPNVVGRKGQGLKAVRIESEVRVDDPRASGAAPGSELYLGQTPMQTRATDISVAPLTDLTGARAPAAAVADVARRRKNGSRTLLTSLGAMVRTNNEAAKFKLDKADDGRGL